MPIGESQHVWQFDGHTVTIRYESNAGWMFTAVCPHGDEADMTGRPWEQVPLCRRTPGTKSQVNPQCEVHAASLNWCDEELWDEQGTSGYQVATGPIPVAWRRDADGVWLCPIDPDTANAEAEAVVASAGGEGA